VHAEPFGHLSCPFYGKIWSFDKKAIKKNLQCFLFVFDNSLLFNLAILFILLSPCVMKELSSADGYLEGCTFPCCWVYSCVKAI
jgi:hypothetical protein